MCVTMHVHYLRLIVSDEWRESSHDGHQIKRNNFILWRDMRKVY